MLTLLLGGEFLADEGTPKYLHGSYQYTTERKRVETHLAAARDKAPEASAAKTAFLGAMSHELLTPLNAIIGFTDLILQETVGPISQPGYLEFARSVRTAGQRALAVFRDVLMMAELEADLFPLHLEEIDLCALAEAVVREFRRTSASSDRVIVVDATEESAAVHADPRAVRQMLEKLLSNAAKFSPAGSAIAKAVVSGCDGSVRVSVADAGIGMTGEEIAAAIRPFGQVADGLTRVWASA